MNERTGLVLHAISIQQSLATEGIHVTLEQVIENQPRELSHRCHTCGITKRSVITADNLRPTSSSSGPRLQVAIETDVQASGSIVLISDKLDSVYYAQVMQVSPECKYVKPGDRVVFVRSVGVKIPVAGIGETRLIHEHEVLGIVEEAAA